MAKYPGVGGKILLGSLAVTPTYTEIAQVASIGSINITSDETEVTTLDNLTGFKEFVQTFSDAGELPLGLVWDPSLATHGPAFGGLWNLSRSRVMRPYRIVFPVLPLPYYGDLRAFVKGFPTPAITPADPLKADVVLRVSGAVELYRATAGAASVVIPDIFGVDQQTTISTQFPFSLVVTVTDAAGLPVSGVEVTFAAPVSGAACTFDDATKNTDANGIVEVIATANATAGGPYNVTATATGVVTPATFHLKNL